MDKLITMDKQTPIAIRERTLHTWLILKCIMLSEGSQTYRLYAAWLHSCDILEKGKECGDGEQVRGWQGLG